MGKNGKMSVVERRELKSVIKQSFKLLRTELAAHEGQVQLDSIDVIEQATESDMVAYQREADKVLARLLKAWKAAEDRIGELADQFGINQGRMYNSPITVDNRYHPGGDSYTALALSPWTHDVRTKETARVTAEITQAARVGRVAIDRQELDMNRTVALDALESDFARSLIDEIPTPQALVAAPDLKALTG